MRKFVPCCLLVSAVAVSALLWADDQVIEEIVARVNNQIVTHSEYLHAEQEIAEKKSSNKIRLMRTGSSPTARRTSFATSLINNCCWKRARTWGSLRIPK